MNTRSLGRRLLALSMTPFVLLAGATYLPTAQAQNNAPIKLVVPFPAGGGTDAVARIIGNHYSVLNNTPMVVDNRPGASGTIGINIASKLPADGNNLVIG